MKKLLLVSLLLTGCSALDKTQAVRDCTFDAIKFSKDAVEQDDYIYACMHKKGYDFTFKGGCIAYKGSDTCWEHTWRVFLI